MDYERKIGFKNNSKVLDLSVGNLDFLNLRILIDVQVEMSRQLKPKLKK